MYNTNDELKRMVDSIAQELKAIYNSELINEETSEPMTFWDYFEDVLDLDYIIGSDCKTVRGVHLWVTLGGPNIRIDTFSGDVKGFWGSDRQEAWVPVEICDEINDIFQEYFNCM